MLNRRRLLSDTAPILLLASSVVVFFYKVLLSGKPLFGSDFVLQFYPWKQFIYESVRTLGGLPFWNPYVLSGTPFIGNIQASMFYPLGFLFYLMPADQAFGYTIILHFILGAVFMYAFCRSIPMGHGGALVAAIIFVFNGFLVAHLYAGHLTFVQNYVWIPLILLCLNKFFRTLELRFAILGGLCLGAQILGGFPQIAFYTILTALLYTAYHMALCLKDGRKRPLLRVLAGTSLVLVIGFCLAAVQLWPTYEFAQLSGRSGGVSYEFATSDSFDPVNFVTFVLPNFLGNAANRTYWKSEEVWQFWELCAYVGIGPLLLLGLTRKDAPSRRVRFFFGFLMLFALFMALGRYNPLYRLIYHLPGFSHFRIPAQILYLYVFSVSILAGAGLNTLNDVKSYPLLYKIMVGAGAVGLGGLTIAFFFFPTGFFEVVFKVVQPSALTADFSHDLYAATRLSILTAAGLFALLTMLIHWHHLGRIGPIPFTVTLVLVITADLWLFANPMIQTTDLSPSSKKISLFESLAKDPDIFRVVTASDFLKPNEALLYGYQNIEGYDPLILKKYLAYVNKSQNTPQFSEAVHIYYVTKLDNNLIRLLNLKYAIGQNGEVLKLQKSLPRAFMVPTAITVPPETTLDTMMRRDFEPTREVVLAPDDNDFIFPEQSADGFQGSCRISHYDQEMIRISTSANRAGYLVLSEVFYPGWEASVDGRKVSILQGDYLLRVIPLEKGNHEVQFRFVSRPFRLGLTVSLLTLVGCFVFIRWESQRRKNVRQSAGKKEPSPDDNTVHISVRISHQDGRPPNP